MDSASQCPFGVESDVVRMKILIRNRGSVMTKKLRAYVLRRLYFVLSRFGEKVVGVRVGVSKEKGPPGNGQSSNGQSGNGHPGGPETRCQIDVDLARSVKATATHGDPLVAVDRAAAGAGRSVARALDRERETEQWPFRPLGTKRVKSSR